jgi:hypothetical protein
MMAINPPVAGSEINATAWGIPLTNEVNRLTPLVIAPTAWVALPLNTGAGWAAAGGYQAPQYRRINDIVYLRGTANRTPNTPVDGVIATLPSGFRPPATVSDMCQVYGALIRTDIGSNGQINALGAYYIGSNAGNWSYYVLDNISFSTIT